MEVIIDTAIFVFVKFFAILGIICGTIGMMAFFVYLLIRGIFKLREAIISEKIWRVALKEYVEKRNPSAKRVNIFNKKLILSETKEKDGDN